METLVKKWLDQTLMSFFSSRHKKKKLLYSILPHLSMEAMTKYLRLEVEGVENLPQKGALIIPNHAGFFGLDAMILAHELPKHTLMNTKILTHRLWFALDFLGKNAKKLGFIEATKTKGTYELKKNHFVVLFPEGEEGNFKPSHKAYKLQEFKRGFVRMAFETGVPIVPTVMMGAEETHINLHQIKVKNMKLPLPLNFFPLPVFWKICFLKPIHFPYNPKLASHKEEVYKATRHVKHLIQNAIDKELENRPGIFIKRPPFLKKLMKKYTRF